MVARTTINLQKLHTAKILDVALGKMRRIESGKAQRPMREKRVDYLLANLDLHNLGLPKVNLRGGVYYLIDGQHRVEALKRWLGTGWEHQKIPCQVYEGLNESEEADMFDRCNDYLNVTAFDRFKNRVTAKREVEVAIMAILASEGLSVGQHGNANTNDEEVTCVSTLVKVYKRTGPDVLQKTLRIVRDAFGVAGVKSMVVDGVSHVVHRYADSLNERTFTESLSGIKGGVFGLLGQATVLQKQTGTGKAQCVAAACVDIINRHRSGKARLPSWWHTDGKKGGVISVQR